MLLKMASKGSGDGHGIADLEFSDCHGNWMNGVCSVAETVPPTATTTSTSTSTARSRALSLGRIAIVYKRLEPLLLLSACPFRQ